MEKRKFSAGEKYQIMEEGRAPGAGIAEICRRHQVLTNLYNASVVKMFLREKFIIIEILALLVIGLLFFFLVPLHTPFSMDEFIHYHALSCHYYPYNLLNKVGWGSCTVCDLAPIANHYISLRSYKYLGSISGLIYYPLFKLWPSPYSARLLGLMAIAIQAIFIYKLLKVDLLLSFIVLVFYMPYSFQHLVDTGPVSFHTTSVFFLCYVAQKWKKSIQNDTPSSWVYPLLMGLVIFCGIWIKLSYFFILPGIIILIFYLSMSGKIIFVSIRRLTQHLIILFIAGGLPSFILLNSKDRLNRRYFGMILSGGMANNFKNSIRHLYDLSKYFFNPLNSAHRIFGADGRSVTLSGLILTAIIIIFLFSGIRMLRAKKMKYGFVPLNILLFLMTIYIISMSPRTWAMHHVVLSLPFLLLAVFYVCSELQKSKLILLMITAFLGVNFSLYHDMNKLKPLECNHPSLLKINKLLNQRYAHQYVFIVIDWGMFYIKALYGDKDQCVLYLQPLDSMKQISEVKNILDKTGRKALFIGRVDSVSDLPFIAGCFPDLLELKTNFDTGKWRIWCQP